MEIENNLHDAISDLLKKHPEEQDTGLYKSISHWLSDHTIESRQDESIAKHKHLEKLAHIGHYEIDLPTGNASWSDETFRIFGMNPKTSKEPTIEEYRKYIHPEDQDKVYRLFERCIRESIEFNLIYRIIDKNKNTKHVHSIGTFHRNAKKMFGTFQDVSKQMAILQVLEESETKYRLLADNSYDIVALFKNYELTYISPAVTTITGYSQQEYMKLNLFNLIHPDDRYRIEQILQDRKTNMKTGPITYEFRQKHKKGNYLWVQSVVNSYKAPSNKCMHSVMIIRDITEKKRQEESLKENEHFYKTILTNIWDSVFLTDGFGNLTYICSNSRHIFGYNKDEMKALKTIQNILNPEPSNHDNLNMQDLHNSEATIKDKSGNEHHLLVTAKKVEIRDSKYLVTCKDISDLKVIQSELSLNEERFRTYFREDCNIKLLIDTDTGKIVDASDCAVQFYGYPLERLTNMKIGDINKLTADEVKKEMNNAFSKNKKVFHFKHGLANGQIRDVTVYSAPFTVHGQNLLLSTIFDVTEHLAAQRNLEESEKRFRVLFYGHASPMLIINPENGNIEEANESASRFYGYPTNVLTTLNISQINTLPPDELKEELQQSGKNGKTHFYYKHKLANNDVRDVEIFSVRLKLNDQNFIHAIIHDITEKKRADEQKQLLNERMEFAMQTNRMAWWEMELPSGRVIFNSNKTRMLGYEDSAFKTYEDFMKLVHPDDYESTMNAMQMHLDGKRELYKCEYRIQSKDNGYIWYRDVGRISHRYSNGFRVTGVSKDISDYKSKEQELRESEEKYKALYINAPLAYQSLNENGNILDINPQWERVLGYKKDEVIGKWFGDFLHDEYVAHFKKNFPVFKKRGVIHDVQFRMKKKDGRFIHVSFEGCIGNNEAGKFKQTYCTFKDVTMEHAIGKKLKESEERFRKLIENMDEGVILVSPESAIVQHNQAALNILEVSTRSLAGIQVADFNLKTIHEDGTEFPAHDHPAMITIRKNIPQHNVIMGIVLQNNTTKWLKINSEPFYLSDNENVHALVSFSDITSLVEKEKKLMESNATKDRFFSILAHDLKNPFNALLGFTELLMQNYDRYDAQKHKKFISLLNRSAKSAHLLLENLLIWSRSQRDTIAFNPAKTAVKPIIDLIFRQHESGFITKSIAVSSHIEPDKINVYADIEMLKTVLRNLISNAIKFTPENGEISVSCTESPTDTIFSVKDSGVGIKKEDQKKLFQVDSTFTSEGTRREKGTGLGLILCKDFVERHGGKINVKSKKGSGSTFTFTIPLKN